MFDVAYGFFDVMPILFVVMFVLIAAAIVGTLVKGAAQFHRDNQSPRLSVAAVLVAKRQDFHRGAGDQSVGYTDYFLTFEVESGDRMELEVKGEEYGLLTEGDKGILNFQGKRYLGFERRV